MGYGQDFVSKYCTVRTIVLLVEDTQRAWRSGGQTKDGIFAFALPTLVSVPLRVGGDGDLLRIFYLKLEGIFHTDIQIPLRRDVCVQEHCLVFSVEGRKSGDFIAKIFVEYRLGFPPKVLATRF